MKTWQVLAIAQRAQSSWIPAANRSEHPDQEQLEQLALDQAPAEDRVTIESHLSQCEVCRTGFEEARIFAERLQALLRAQGRQDQRKTVRYRVRESAIIMLCHPVESQPLIGQVMDVSAQGLRIRLPRSIYRGSQVQVQVEKAVVFGSVRYCRTLENQKYDIGIAIDQIVMSTEQYLPKNTAGEQRDKTGSRSNDRAGADPIEVLLVEDNPADVKLMQLMFQELGVKYRLAVAADGVQALGRLLDPAMPKPNLVLLDLTLPRLSGLEVLKRLRNERATQSVAVAVLSGSNAAADLQRSTALGIRAYLVKPKSVVECEDLRNNLGALISDTTH